MEDKQEHYESMDLIAGLPGDTPEGFADSLGQVLALRPSNVTVHTLALKKGAELFRSRADLPGAEAVARMLAEGQTALRRGGYEPYYLYRQKYMRTLSPPLPDLGRRRRAGSKETINKRKRYSL